MRKPTSQLKHDEIVRRIAKHLPSEGYKSVKADLVDHTTPEKIIWKETGEGHIPDVTATDSDRQHIFEVETEDSITSGHTAEQWKLFSAFAKQHNANFWVAVPTGLEKEAEEQVKTLGLKATIIGL